MLVGWPGVEVSLLAKFTHDFLFGEWDARTIFFASWGLEWRGGGEEVVGGFVFDVGGGCWEGSAGGCCWSGFWISGGEEGDRDILMRDWEMRLKERLFWNDDLTEQELLEMQTI